MKALITGAYGQDGRLLSEFLVSRGYEVHGVVRQRKGAIDGVTLHEIDVVDPRLRTVVREVAPDEVYNLAAPSHVGSSLIFPQDVVPSIVLGALNVFEAIRLEAPSARVYQASSSEIFGNATESPQDERTHLAPLSPYGCAKAYAHMQARAYRWTRGLYIACGIAYNHESRLRSPIYVTRRITQFVARAASGASTGKLALGDLDAVRDWGDARDYVRAMWAALQQPNSRDYVLATGTTRSVADLAAAAFEIVGLNWRDHVESVPGLRRLAEPTARLCGNPRKAEEVLGWKREHTLEDTLRDMIDADR